MIFLILGSQKFSFDRLLKEIDRLIECNVLQDNVVAQVGYSVYEPLYFKAVRFMDKKEFEKNIDESEYVISHGGTGSILSALKKKKKVIVVPRLEKYKEHVDNHQLEITEAFQKLKYIEVVLKIEDLEKKIGTIHSKKFSIYESTNDNIILDIIRFLEGN